MQDSMKTRGATQCTSPWCGDDEMAHIEDSIRSGEFEMSNTASMVQDIPFTKEEQARNERRKYGIEIGMCVELVVQWHRTGLVGTTIAHRIEPTEHHGPDVQFLVRFDEEYYERLLPHAYSPYGVAYCCNRPVPLEHWCSALYLKVVSK